MRLAAATLFLLAGVAGAETLRYTVNWPSGLSLGEGEIGSAIKGEGYEYSLRLDASIPGVPIEDRYRSRTRPGFCSESFEKESRHGNRVASETLTFEPGKVIRKTNVEGGGRTEIPTGECARDALAFLFFLRSELQKGRLPPAQTVYFGAPYQISVRFGGTHPIQVNGNPAKGDKLNVTAKGPASTTSFEIFFAKDRERTPLVIRAPFPLGIFSMELDGELPTE
jgi:hypothetical protein